MKCLAFFLDKSKSRKRKMITKSEFLCVCPLCAQVFTGLNSHVEIYVYLVSPVRTAQKQDMLKYICEMN
jgi:hypothetical protein